MQENKSPRAKVVLHGSSEPCYNEPLTTQGGRQFQRPSSCKLLLSIRPGSSLSESAGGGWAKMIETLLWLGAVAGLMSIGLPLAASAPGAALAVLPLLAGASLKCVRAWTSCITDLAASDSQPLRAVRRQTVVRPLRRQRRILTPLDLCAS